MSASLPVPTYQRVWKYVTRAHREERDFARIAATLKCRTDALVEAQGRLQESMPDRVTNEDLLFRLAAVDLFVEKAQRVLTSRARQMVWAGVAATATSVLVLGTLVLYLATRANVSADLSTNQMIVHVVAAISLGGVVLVAVKWLVALARSFFHESVILLARRHALRFGRMYVYMNPAEVELDQLREAFDWNRGGESSFLDIKPGEIGQTPWSAFALALGEGIGRGVDLAQKSAPAKR